MQLPRPSRDPAALAAWAPGLLLVALGLALLWPVPLGHMPLSADHTVHLSRAALWARELSAGHLRGWSPHWAFGVPVGELYPVLGDVLVILPRALTLGAAPWPVAYALGFTVAFLIQGLALARAARLWGLGPLAATLAGALVLADVGQYREGGWIYTVTYGVWPQTLATALSWWGLAALHRALRAQAGARELARAGALLGAAVLAHPMTLPVAALAGGVIVAVALADRRRSAAPGSAASEPGPVGVTLWRAGVVAALALGLAAWWLVPMLAHRGWMASYGWLGPPLRAMVHRALAGQLADHVPATVTALALVGIGIAILRRDPGLRAVAATFLALWLLASADLYWTLRLDHLSAGFQHIQYQRFLASAKPGAFLLAAAAVEALWRAFPRGASDGRARRALRGLARAVAVGAVVYGGAQQVRLARENRVGRPQIRRFPGHPQRDADYGALLRWMGARWAERDGFFRFVARAPRNAHWFMDAPALAGTPVYKVGFTPGDNFVHKPESARPEVLRALGARYVFSLRPGRPAASEVARMGDFAVFPAPRPPRPVAWLDGPGTLELTQADPLAGPIRGRVEGAGDGSRLVFAVAGYPRWELRQAGQVVPWVEVPVWGDGPSARPEDRRAGKLRGGKAHGDDGSEPTLIAARVADGEFELRYRYWTARDVLALLASVLALGLCGALVARGRGARLRGALAAAEATCARRVRPVHVVLFLLVLAGAVGVRAAAASRAEASHAFAWLRRGAAKVRGAGRVSVGPLKADMTIFPAVRLAPRPQGALTLVFPGVPGGGTVTGWIAPDDDAAKAWRGRGRLQVRVEAAPAGTDAFHTLWAATLPRRPGRTMLAFDLPEGTFDLRVKVAADGPVPPAGFDLDLGAEGEGAP